MSERDLSSLSREGREAAALASFEELSQHRQWPRGEALVRVRLLHLGADGSELQVCTPHIVSDDVSLGVFFEELAAGYLRLKGERPAEAPETSTSYQTVLRDERLSLARTLEQDICFWEAYAGGTAPIVFPESEVLAPGDPDEAVCVTLPALLLTMLSSVARQQRLGVSDLLQAATLSAVSPFVAASSAAKPVLLSTPVSTRQSMETARTIGLFARYDLLKVDVSEHSADPLALARRVRLAKIETEPHQACPYAVKVASADGRRWRGRVVPELVARAAARAITTFYRGLEFDYRAVLATMRLAGARRAEVRGHALFVNVMSSVIDEPGRSLFGYPLNEPPTMLTERSPVRGVLDVTFLREPNRANNCLVRVTGDLRPGFRQRLGEAIVAALEQTAVKQAESKCEVSLS